MYLKKKINICREYNWIDDPRKIPYRWVSFIMETGSGYKKGCLKPCTFPKYKILTDTKYNRDKAEKLVKDILFLP